MLIIGEWVAGVDRVWLPSGPDRGAEAAWAQHHRQSLTSARPLQLDQTLIQTLFGISQMFDVNLGIAETQLVLRKESGKFFGQSPALSSPAAPRFTDVAVLTPSLSTFPTLSSHVRLAQEWVSPLTDLAAIAWARAKTGADPTSAASQSPRCVLSASGGGRRQAGWQAGRRRWL